METASGTYDSENRSVEEMTRYLNGLKRYTEKGIPIYMDGKLSGQREWEKLFEVREDGMFYMGDYVQAEGGGLKEIRFDKVYRSGYHGDERSEEKNEKIRKDGGYRIEWIWRYWIAVNRTEMNQVICTK